MKPITITLGRDKHGKFARLPTSRRFPWLVVLLCGLIVAHLVACFFCKNIPWWM